MTLSRDARLLGRPSRAECDNGPRWNRSADAGPSKFPKKAGGSSLPGSPEGADAADLNAIDQRATALKLDAAGLAGVQVDQARLDRQ